MLPIVQKEHKVAPQHITTTAETTKKKRNIANACTEYDHNNISYLNICLNSYKTINHKQCNTFNWLPIYVCTHGNANVETMIRSKHGMMESMNTFICWHLLL